MDSRKTFLSLHEEMELDNMQSQSRSAPPSLHGNQPTQSMPIPHCITTEPEHTVSEQPHIDRSISISSSSEDMTSLPSSDQGEEIIVGIADVEWRNGSASVSS